MLAGAAGPLEGLCTQATQQRAHVTSSATQRAEFDAAPSLTDRGEDQAADMHMNLVRPAVSQRPMPTACSMGAQPHPQRPSHLALHPKQACALQPATAACPRRHHPARRHAPPPLHSSATLNGHASLNGHAPPHTVSAQWDQVFGAPAMPGDARCDPSAAVALLMRNPTYTINILYDARNRVLSGCSRIWAHLGHSGWRDTVDVEMRRVAGDASNGDGELWACEYSIPAGRLQSFGHLEVQMVFKGFRDGCGERWDNNGGWWLLNVEEEKVKGF